MVCGVDFNTITIKLKEMNQNQNGATVAASISEKQFRDEVMPRAQLSKLACEIAIAKTSSPDVKEFAQWELMEATTVIDVLEDLGTPVSPASADAAAFLQKLNNLSGNEFDKEYMAAELSNHEFLRDLAQGYVDGTDAKPLGKDKETWHVAGLALFAFTEHVGLCKKIIAGLTA
jgi:predicted outer membrane protein